MAHPHRGSAGPARAGVQRTGGRAAGALRRRAGRAGRRLRRRRPRRAGRPPRRRPRVPAPSSTSTPARACTATRSTAATGTARAGGRSASRATSSRGAGPTTEVHRPWLTSTPTRSSSAAARRADRGRRAHRRGLVGRRPREGPQPPPRPRAAVRPAGRVLQRRAQVRPAPLPRPGSAGRAPHLPADRGRRRPALHRRRQQPARRRSAGAAPTPTASSPASGRRTSPCLSARGPVDGCGRGRLAARLRRPRALLRRGRAPDRRGGRRRRQPVRRLAVRARTRCHPAPTCSARRSPPRRPSGAGLHPYRAPTGREQRALRRPPGLQQLRLLRTSAARSTPRATRSPSLRRALAHRPVPSCGPRPYVTDVLVDAHGPPGDGRRATSTPSGERPRGAGRPRRPGRRRLRDPPAPAAQRRRPTRRAWSAGTSRSTSRPSRSAASRSRCTASGAAASPTSWTTRSCPGPTRTPPPGPPACPGSGAGPSSTAASTLPIQEALNYPPGPQHNRVDAGLGPAGPPLGVHHAGRGPAPARQPHRPRPDGRRRLGLPRRPGHLRPPPPRAGGLRPLGPDPRGGDARRRRRVGVLQHLAARSARPTRRLEHPLGLAPASKHVMGTCRMGADPTTSVVGPEGRFHDIENLLCADSSVFVTSAGLQPDAHDRRPRPPGGVAADGLGASHPWGAVLPRDNSVHSLKIRPLRPMSHSWVLARFRVAESPRSRPWPSGWWSTSRPTPSSPSGWTTSGPRPPPRWRAPPACSPGAAPDPSASTGSDAAGAGT